ncbi:MAG: heparinase II/III family protein, partial [Burkholderiales bacterium]|nr:heparinase II/III family protein [Opitutaceae bacterium]
AYERATRVNWRSGWADDASGVWVRGGHEKDFHDHQDRGHVNVILHGRPVLIEADNANYAAENFASYYHARIGHNVIDLQGRPAPTSTAPAPITVARLDATGGELTVNPTPGYRRLERWERKVSWTADRAEITDVVAVANEGTETIVAYWHTGSSAPVELTGEGTEWTARWADAVLTFRANTPIIVTQTKSPDRTLIPSNQAPDHLHAFLTVTTIEEVARFELTTTATVPAPAP